MKRDYNRNKKNEADNYFINFMLLIEVLDMNIEACLLFGRACPWISRYFYYFLCKLLPHTML